MSIINKLYGDGSPLIVLEKYSEIPYALVYRPEAYQKFVVVWYLNDVNPDAVSWSQGHYFDTLSDAVAYVKILKAGGYTDAMAHVNYYCMAEYGHPADFSDLSRVSIAYTEYEEDESPVQSVQVYVDFIHKRILYDYYFYEEDKIETRINRFDTYEAFYDEIRFSDFGEMTALPCEYMREYMEGDDEA